MLFQVYFLSLLLEERGAGSLAEVAEHCTEKLIRRHPHVFGEASASSAAEVLRNWDQIKSTRGRAASRGCSARSPRTCRRCCTRGKCSGALLRAGSTSRASRRRSQAVRDELGELEAAGDSREQFDELGDVLFAAVNVARKLRVDPELALRASADRFRGRVSAGIELAASDDRNWNDLMPDEQLSYYARARLAEGGPGSIDPRRAGNPDEPDRASPRAPDP